jgi:alpha-ketoglutarate-dependent taurine dioxygenase/MFS family permease
VATPLLADELGKHGLSHGAALIRIGSISSLGVLAYALGKLLLGGLGDYWGGRVSFLIGLGGATFFTLLFATSSFVPVFTLAWFGNRLTQSVAWAGLLKVSSRWFDFSSHGAVIGVLSISYLIGDAAARQSMGVLIQSGVGWRPLFYLAAAIAGILFAANYFFLRESRADAGFPQARANPLNLFANEATPRRLRDFLLPLLRSRAFLLVCLLSLGCTIIRETFNGWTPVYLHDYLRYSMGRAAGMSAVFPAVGAVSVVATGWLSDRLGVNGRPLLLLLGLSATAAALLVLMSMHAVERGESADSAARHRHDRVLPARTLLLPWRRLRPGFRWKTGIRHRLRHHRRCRLSRRGRRRRQRGPCFGRLWLAGRVRVLVGGQRPGRDRRGHPLLLEHARSRDRTPLTMSPPEQIIRVSADPEALTVEWASGRIAEFDSLWLRDNRVEDRDRHSGQRLVDISEVPEHPVIRGIQTQLGDVKIEWEGESAPATFSFDWLAAHAPDAADAGCVDAPERLPQTWIGGELDARRDFAWTALEELRSRPAVRLEWLTRLLQTGMAFLSGVPATNEAILDAMSLAGQVCETNYGLVFDVRAVPQPENLAYSDLGLGLHTDNPYREPVPGFQALHTLLASPDGGASLFADGFALAEHLRATDPETFATLTRTPVPFAYRSKNAELYAERPFIQLSCDGRVIAIHYNNRSIAPLRLSRRQAPGFYTAYRRFAELLQDGTFQLQFKLSAGDLVLFDNQCILHGRTAFSSATHGRHLRGCYLTRDSVYSETALLRRQLNQKASP